MTICEIDNKIDYKEMQELHLPYSNAILFFVIFLKTHFLMRGLFIEYDDDDDDIRLL